MKRHSRVLCAVTLVALPLFLIGCGPNGPSDDPRNAPAATDSDKLAVAIGGGQRDPMNLVPPDNHTAKPMVTAPQLEDGNNTRTYENGFLIDTDVNGSTVRIPSYWEVLSVQRHGLPLNLYEDYGGNTATLSYGLNKASERLSRVYTVTFKVHVTAEINRFEVRTLTIPEGNITFTSQ